MVCCTLPTLYLNWCYMEYTFFFLGKIFSMTSGDETFKRRKRSIISCVFSYHPKVSPPLQLLFVHSTPSALVLPDKSYPSNKSFSKSPRTITQGYIPVYPTLSPRPNRYLCAFPRPKSSREMQYSRAASIRIPPFYESSAVRVRGMLKEMKKRRLVNCFDQMAPQICNPAL